MIVVEGVDNSGKSTLIETLHKYVFPEYNVQGSEGPPKYKGEMDERVTRYLAHPTNTIYDRHPCVSQPIYGTMRSHLDPIAPDLIRRFYSSSPLFIYCDGGIRGMNDHTFNPETDTKAHLDAVTENYTKLLIQYRHWAAQHAFISYRIGNNMSRIVHVLEQLKQAGYL